jgi:hypothetical protein
MYATLYGQRSVVEPEETHFHRASNGIWHLRKASLLENDIMDAFEKLNLKCVQLLFDSADQFWDTIETSNFDVIQAGIDPEALKSRDEFAEELNKMENPLEKKLIYYYSVRHYNHVAQNMIKHILISLGDAYALLSEPNLYEEVPLHVQAYGEGEIFRNSISPSGHRIWTNISFCIEKTVSFLDFMTKYVFEISQINLGAVPNKPRARNETFSSWSKIRLAKDTPLSEWSDDLRLIHSLRDETVHNGTIDHHSKIYEHTIGSVVQRRFMLLPDHEKGRFLTSAGRKRFYRQDNHLNAVLPSILEAVFRDALSSLNKIDHGINDQWDDPNSYFERYSDVFAVNQSAADIGAFIKSSNTEEPSNLALSFHKRK